MSTASYHALTVLLEADATYSWLLPDGTILPVSSGNRHEDVAKSHYRDTVGEPLEGGTYEDWAMRQGWVRLVGTGFEAASLNRSTMRRVQQTYLDAGVRDMGTSFFIDIREPGTRNWQSFEVPYREFLDMGGPGELRRYRFESLKESLDAQITAVERELAGADADNHYNPRLLLRQATLYHRAGRQLPPKLIRTSYSHWDDEAVAAGDTDDRGWHDEEGVDFNPDEVDVADGKLAVDMAIKWLEDEGATNEGADWYTATAEDHYTGEFTEYNYHLDGFTVAEENAVADGLAQREKDRQRSWDRSRAMSAWRDRARQTQRARE